MASMIINEYIMQSESPSQSIQPASNVKEAGITSKSGLSRRSFLALAWKSLLALSGLFGLGGLGRYLTYKTDPPAPTQFDLGPAESYAPGTRTLLSEAHAVLLRTGDDYQAFSLVCPHLGCQVNPSKDGFACPCHGSQFGDQGQLLRGPADRPLTRLRLEKRADGHLVLYTN
jgi:cytochrome b6-f complex iron-sulfur subunit